MTNAPTHPAARIIMICPVCEGEILKLWEDGLLIGNQTVIIKDKNSVQCKKGHVHGAGAELRYSIGTPKEA